MAPLIIKKGLSINQLIIYAVAFFLAFWCLGRSIPYLGVGYFTIGLLLLFYVSPMLFIGKRFTLTRPWLWLSFVGVHFLLVNYTHRNTHTSDFLFHLFFAFLFFFFLINLIERFDQYEKFILVLMVTLSVITAYLIVMHLFVFKSLYLTPHLTYGSWWAMGRSMKNTLSLFLALIFPFAYVLFVHKKSFLTTFMFITLGFGAVYTLSRMALVSFFSTILVACLFSLSRKIFLKHLIVIGLVFFLIQMTMGLGIKSFMKLKYVSDQDRMMIDMGEKQFVKFEGHRFMLITVALQGFVNKPLFGNGVATFRGLDVTGGSLSHNDFAQILYEMGLIGMALFLTMFFVSFYDLMKSRASVPKERVWLWNGQVAALINISLVLLFSNAYETVPFWLILAGCQVVAKLVDKDLRCKAKLQEVT